MESKCQKKRRHSKKSKKTTGDKNTNVLVVPPDILKKLGINIGSVQPTVLGQQIVNNVTAVQSSEIADNSLQGDILTPIYTNGGNESSIQETANLMKKSVFLSPTFIDTVANVIPGEVEFSNNKSFTDHEIDKSLPVEVRYETNYIDEPNYIQSTIKCDLITNGVNTLPTVNGEINKDQIIIENVEIINDQTVNELISLRKQDCISIEENKQTIDKVSLDQPKINDKKYNTIATEKMQLLNNLVPMQEQTQVNNKDLLDEEIKKHLIPMTVLGETSAGSDDGKTIVVEYCELDPKVLALEENIIANTVEDNINTLPSYSETFSVHIKPTESTNFMSLEEIMNLNETENMNNLISTEGGYVQIPLAEFEVNHMYEKDSMNVIVDANIDSNLITIQGSALQINQMECENNLVNSKELLDETTVAQIEKNITSLGQVVQTKEAENGCSNMSLQQPAKSEQCLPNQIDHQTELTKTQNIATVLDNINENNEADTTDIHEKILLNENNKSILNKILKSNTVVNSKLYGLLNGEINDLNIQNASGNVLQLPLQQQSSEIKSDTVTAGKKEKIRIISQEIIVSSDSKLNHKKSQFPVTNTVNFNDIGEDSTDNNRKVSYNSDIMNSKTLIAGTPNSVELEPPISTQIDNSIKSSIFSVPVEANELLGNALLTNNNTDHIMNKHIDTICGVAEDKVVSNNLKPEKLSENRNLIKKKNIDNISAQENTSKKTNTSENEELYEDELNNLLKSSKENNNAISQADKVKEIANCIKKFAHLYKEKKVEKKRGVVKAKNDRKESINAKVTMSKSKLCIQGVEKPGGNEYQKETSGERKVLKTYARQKKNPDFKKTEIKLDNIENIPCNIKDGFLIDDLNNIDVAISSKKQDFCLCYDFGHLYDCDNSYEHIHFWHHNSSTDLETIISIYNDTIYTDRTLLNNDVLETPVDDTVFEYICWNYFSCGCVKENAILEDLGTKELQEDSSTIRTVIAKKNNLKSDTNVITDKNTNNKKQQPVKIGVSSTEVDTNDAVEGEDKESKKNNKNNVKEESSKKKSEVMSNIHTKKDDGSCSKKSLCKEDKFRETNLTKDCASKEISKANPDEPVMKVAESEPSNKRAKKRSYSRRSSVEPTDTDHNEEPSLKTNIKCGVCSKLLPKDNWDDHVVKHCHIAWQAGTSFNIDDPDLIKKLENTLKVAGKLKCPCCYTQTKSMDKFMNHIKKCVALQDAMKLVTNKEESKEKISVHSNVSSKRSLNRSDSNRDSLEKSSAVGCEPLANKNVKCGVCNQLIPEEKWEDHVADEHCHIAWIAGSTFNVNDPELLEKLQNKLQVAKLKCPSCHTKTKHMNKFLNHIKTCLGIKDTSSRRKSYKKDTVKCAICKQNVEYTSWAEHIGREHNYLAWIDGREDLDLEDESAVIKHLKQIVRNIGSLICYKCGLSRQRAQLYLDHIKTCKKTEVHCHSINKKLNSTNTQEVASTSDSKLLTCGVCKQQVLITKWVEHIAKEHNYLAWEEGSTPLNLDDEEAVWNYLKQFIRQNADGLVCYKCGLSRRRVKLYLSHIKTCDGEGVNLEENPKVVIMNKETNERKGLICGVCNTMVAIKDWYEHIGKEHNYLAWTADVVPVDVNDEEAVKEHLQEIIRHYEYLTCHKCGVKRKRVVYYLSHVRNCDGDQTRANESKNNISMEIEVDVDLDTSEQSGPKVTCAICNKEVAPDKWIDHIGKQHQYIAWHQGETPLDVTDEDAIKLHLSNICKEKDGLTCNKCQTVKKYPKTFQQHITDCTGKPSAKDSKVNIYETSTDYFDVSEITSETVTCGVCNIAVLTTEWTTHAQKEHNYIAWYVGKPPIDVDDPAMVLKHLVDVTRKLGELKCSKCGVIRRYAKKFYDHISSCEAPIVTSDEVVCGVCSESVAAKHWRDHAMNKHYNVAWIVGEPPIDINLPYVVEPYIKVYQSKHKRLVCKICNITRVSAVGFYAHIITCGKTDEEMEPYKAMCDLCNNKYLLIYKNQHIAMHKEKEMALERKLLLAKEKEMAKTIFEPVEIVGGRRKAAVKAKTVIEKYTLKSNDGTQCKSCGFHSEIESEMSSHVCVEIKNEDSGSDASIDSDNDSTDDDDSDVNSNISEEEREAQEEELVKPKKHGDCRPRIHRLPYAVRNVNALMRQSAQHFAELHLTDEDLFTEWRKLEYEIVSEDDVKNYMPPLEESCKVTYGGEWNVYKRFEASLRKDTFTLFTGACIQSVRWVPSHVKEDLSEENQYLSVISHLSTDVPRQCWYETPEAKPTLIQIWNCANFNSNVPEFVMGLALDCGTIWAVDWCPSGSRDRLDPEKSNEVQRLGLLAAACANGYAYIFSVPYPSTIKESGQIFCKLKPVVELRVAMKTDREKYPATAIKWSTQKGHAHIVVGYGNGTIAYFDLKNESPLLRSEENDVTIIYPYYDERAQGMCIEGVDVFPTQQLSNGMGVVVSGCVGGVGASTRPVSSSSIQAHSAAAKVLFPPHWPAPLLAGDDNLVSQAVNELEWYSGGRRVGGMDACCGCTWCGKVAHVNAPLVKLIRVHPVYTDLHRQAIALLHMIPFGNKRKRKNDELSMIVEPLTYNDTIVKYGIEFKQVIAKDKATRQQLNAIPRDTYPERFPLANVTSMKFCPSSTNHQKLAVAVHSGLIFIINV